MLGTVLGWDLLVAGFLSRPAVTHRFRSLVPAIEHATGILFLALAFGLSHAAPG